MRPLIPLLAISAVVRAAEPSVPAAEEAALRARVGEFYQDFIDQKYRQAEDLVASDSKDDYYAMKKPEIKDYKIIAIKWAEDGKSAEVKITNLTTIRNPRMGDFDAPIPALSHWKLENGKWCWYIPEEMIVQTPFGPEHVFKHPVGAKTMDLKGKIAHAPRPEDLAHGVKANGTTVRIAPGIGSGAAVALQNTLPGKVVLTLNSVSSDAISAELVPAELDANQKASLVVKRLKAGPFPPVHLIVTVQPTQQQIDITVN